MQEKRNIVLITFDSLRADHCSFMGYHRKTTPTLDKMAKEGLWFENAIAPSTNTFVSMPSILTGNFPDFEKEFGIAPKVREFIAQRKTWVQELKKSYHTYGISSNPFFSGYFGFDKDFEILYDFLYYGSEVDSKLIRIIRKLLRKLGNLRSQGKSILFAILENLLALTFREDIYKRWEDYYYLIDHLLTTMEQPFFLWIFVIDTHHPWLIPKRYRHFSKHLDNLYSFNLVIRANPDPQKMNKRRLINSYDDAIYYSDTLLSKLIKDLSHFDPIYIVHADHGEGFGEHGYYKHPSFLYEESIHVPLVIYNADVKGRIDKPVSLLGLGPTILELIGEENEFPSESFLHEGKDWVISKVFEGGKRKVAVRTKDWKFITGQKEEDELYYLKEDPYEQENVISEHPELAKEMRKIVKIHVKQEMERRRIHERISRIKL